MGYQKIVALFWITICGLCLNYNNLISCMSLEEKNQLKEQSKEMFYHAYQAYMDHAYPADELMPLSCKGRYRDIEPNRGDIDDALGNFSLTLVDTLDTLVVLGDFDEFERAVKKVIKDVSFDSDVIVSVFETNIRMLGGLVSGHILASYTQDHLKRMPWYQGELLNMARDLGYRLLPAFNTTTGVPHPRINLRYGLKSPKLGVVRETCTACAGTMILEFAALSRLTGETIFEEKARIAMDYLWQQRHRTSDLMGTVLNIHNGDWIRRDSGVGAGIDSYYEYCLKAYILLGDDVYLERFNKHYSAVMKYVSQGPLLVDVHMHRPHTNSRNFMDALLAFWPGLQVLKGDIKPAIETHEMLYQVMQRHNFLPEAFTVDFQVHWGQHPLRPEFVESTYFLYKATNDPYYLDVGKKVLNSLQKYARVPCGFAAVKDVRTGSHEDRMDSFVLAETLKYLYLLFANKDELTLEVDDFVFTTEAHLLPLSLARISNASLLDSPKLVNIDESVTEDFTHSCPNTHYLFPEGRNFAQTIRIPLKNLVEEVCPSTKAHVRTLHASEFQGNNKEHLEAVRKMGITVLKLGDGKIQLIHNISMAESSERAQEGIMFMQEIVGQTTGLYHLGSLDDYQTVYFHDEGSSLRALLTACPAKFGIDLRGKPPLEAKLQIARPLKACSPIQNGDELQGKIAIIKRGDCMFVDKAHYLQQTGAVGGIVIDNNPGSSLKKTRLFSMDGNGRNDITIPVVFLFSEEAAILLDAFKKNQEIIVGLASGRYEGDVLNEEIANEFNEEPKETDEVTFVDPKSSTKMFEAGGFILAQQRVQSLLSKLHNLKQFKVDLDQLASQINDDFISPAKNDNDAYQQITRETDFIVALERLMKKEKILEIDQDLQIILSRLRELVKMQTFNLNAKDRLFCSNADTKTLNPLVNRGAFIEFMSCKYCPLRNIKKLFHKDSKTSVVPEESVESNVYVERTGKQGLSDKDL
ncbi:ER degradation-enhancing alpha-mannosidase-like protein 3 isoform X2 [Parasteatoda tepidariorum]|uniref:ER degradation-enhancing alpha-mannosidase-like protein 3 isoform X2 n=1 Tax=Parasteatoda tepidariorum TaxID=114398 RepID=UPI00077FCBDB|nr:ER degradation-enhancing alpha-mannosidase-like protein 3 isoform X2 [Parasteatoda tepidariorum]